MGGRPATRSQTKKRGQAQVQGLTNASASESATEQTHERKGKGHGTDTAKRIGWLRCFKWMRLIWNLTCALVGKMFALMHKAWTIVLGAVQYQCPSLGLRIQRAITLILIFILLLASLGTTLVAQWSTVYFKVTSGTAMSTIHHSATDVSGLSITSTPPPSIKELALEYAKSEEEVQTIVFILSAIAQNYEEWTQNSGQALLDVQQHAANDPAILTHMRAMEVSVDELSLSLKSVVANSMLVLNEIRAVVNYTQSFAAEGTAGTSYAFHKSTYLGYLDDIAREIPKLERLIKVVLRKDSQTTKATKILHGALNEREEDLDLQWRKEATNIQAAYEEGHQPHWWDFCFLPFSQGSASPPQPQRQALWVAIQALNQAGESMKWQQDKEAQIEVFEALQRLKSALQPISDWVISKDLRSGKITVLVHAERLEKLFEHAVWDLCGSLQSSRVGEWALKGASMSMGTDAGSEKGVVRSE